VPRTVAAVTSAATPMVVVAAFPATTTAVQPSNNSIAPARKNPSQAGAARGFTVPHGLIDSSRQGKAPPPLQKPH